MIEIPLPGGAMTRPVRIGELVVRRCGERFPVAEALLERFAAAGWSGAPRLRSVAADGTEQLTYLAGDVPWQKPLPAWAAGDAALQAVSRLTREFHDLTVGTELAGAAEVVCHNDLAPNNTIYRDGLPYAFIDWDLAAPGRRVEDVARICWQWLDLGPDVKDVADAARRIRLIADSYGLSDRSDLLATVVWWQERCWRGIEDRAAEGWPAMRRLRDSGAAAEIRRAQQWTESHAGRLR